MVLGTIYISSKYSGWNHKKGESNDALFSMAKAARPW